MGKESYIWILLIVIFFAGFISGQYIHNEDYKYLLKRYKDLQEECHGKRYENL